MPTLKIINVLYKIAHGAILIAFFALLGNIGWDLPQKDKDLLIFTFQSVIWAHLIGFILICLLNLKLPQDQRREHPISTFLQFILSTALLYMSYKGYIYNEFQQIIRINNITIGLTGCLIAIPAFLSLSTFFNFLMKPRKGNGNYSPPLLFLLALIALVLLGSVALLIPNCTEDMGISYLDSLFVCASAVCVTGLTTIDVSSTFTGLGQLFLLILIQLGGLGVMTFAYFISIVLGKGFSLRDRVLFRDIVDSEENDSAADYIKTIIIWTITFEALGAFFLYLSWSNVPSPNNQSIIWHCIFHSISAFCNAGFSTFPEGLAYAPVSQLKSAQGVLMILIILGGLGFFIFNEFTSHFKTFLKTAAQKQSRIKQYNNNRWTTNFYLVTRTTGLLILGGTLFIFLSDILVSPTANWTTNLWDALFYSISSRTAGFNISNVSHYTPSILLTLCALMMIGGSPGGTAGGIRTTTAAVVVAELLRTLRGKKAVAFNRRSIDKEVIDRCIVIVIVSGVWVGGFTILTSLIQPGFSPIALFFENVSAFTTTGLSLGLTGDLNSGNKILIIINMIVGRVGVYSFLLALAGPPAPEWYSYPTTKLPLN